MIGMRCNHNHCATHSRSALETRLVFRGFGAGFSELHRIRSGCMAVPHVTPFATARTVIPGKRTINAPDTQDSTAPVCR